MRSSSWSCTVIPVIPLTIPKLHPSALGSRCFDDLWFRVLGSKVLTWGQLATVGIHAGRAARPESTIWKTLTQRALGAHSGMES